MDDDGEDIPMIGEDGSRSLFRVNMGLCLGVIDSDGLESNYFDCVCSCDIEDHKKIASGYLWYLQIGSTIVVYGVCRQGMQQLVS